MDIEKHIAAAKEFLVLRKKHLKEEKKQVLHSLPISEAERTKREHEAAEHQRFEDVYGDVKITRDTDNYVMKVEKLAEDIIVRDTYTRDANHYITGISTRIIKRKGLSG